MFLWSDNVLGDLHCHTKISDGSMTPEELVDYAARAGLDCLAVTDHDSMAGLPLARQRAKERGIRLIPGLEVSTFDHRHGKKVHLLCYAPQRTGDLKALCDETLHSRYKGSLASIEKIAKKYPIDLSAVERYSAGSTTIYKQHISMTLASMGYSTSVFGDLFKELFSAKSGWARVDPEYPDTFEAMKIIKETGGIAVLAHPGVYDNFDIIGQLCDLGLDGIEVNHPRQSEAAGKAAFEAARENRLIMTGGSDFHGLNSARINPLASRTAPEDSLDQLMKMLKIEV